MIPPVAPHYAGFWRRLAARLIDAVLFSLVAGILHLLIFQQPSFVIVETGYGLDVQSQNTWFDHLVTFLITIFAWVRFMGTPGKLLLGCHVLDATSLQPISWRQALIRYFGYIVSLLPLGLGFWWIIWDKRKQGWHDKMARTLVLVEPGVETDDLSRLSLAELLQEVR